MPSTFNPSDSDSNCFFVTAAYLLGLESVNELPSQVKKKMKEGVGIVGPDGTNEEMEDCLKEMSRRFNRQYRLKSWVDLRSENADNRQGSEVQGGNHGVGGGNLVWRQEQFLLGDLDWNVAQIGIGYTTTDNRAHFIVVKEGTPGNPPSYVCFQNDSGGEDKWMDVRGPNKEVNGNWHDVINQDRAKVTCAFAFQAPEPRTRRFWSKICCCF